MNYLEKNKLIAISDVDTRALVSYIRENGAQNAVITTEVDRIDALRSNFKTPLQWMVGISPKVSTKEPYFVGSPEASLKKRPWT